MKRILLVIILISSSLYSQGKLDNVFNKFDWNKTSFEIDVKPVFNLDTYKSIIIAEVLNSDNKKDKHALDVYDELTTAIVQMKNIELVDRKKTNLLLKEFEFQSSGLVDDKSVKSLGKFVGSGLLLICRVQKDESKDVVKSFKIPIIDIDEGCASTKSRKVTYDFVLNIKLIDLETAKIIYSETINSETEEETRKVNCMEPPEIEASDLYAICLKSIREKFGNLFSNHTTTVAIKFQKNSKFNDLLKNAVTYFNINEFEKGYDILKEIPSAQGKSKAKSSALYNLALVQFYQNDFENSLNNAKDAYVLNPANDDCLTIVNNLKWLDDQ